MTDTHITVRAVSKAYFAFTMMFGFYLMSHGHLSHGAGIAGGALIALGFIQAVIVLGKDATVKVVNPGNAKLTAVLSVSAMLAVSALGYIYGRGFTSDIFDSGRQASSAAMTIVFNISFCFGAIGCLMYLYLALFGNEAKDK